MRLRRVRQVIAALALAAQLAPAAPAWASGTEAPEKPSKAAASDAAGRRCEIDILWADSEKHQLAFLPARCLEGIAFSSPSAAAELSALPLDERSVQYLLGAIRGARNLKREAALKGKPPPCFSGVYSSGTRIDPSSSSLADQALRAEIAVVGRVVAATPGWEPFLSRPVTLVKVDVEEVLHDRTGAVKVGSVVSYVQRAGSFDLGEDATLCWEDEPGFFWAEAGQQVLLFGQVADAVNEGLLGLREVFPVVAGQVVPQPYGHLKAERYGPLLSVRESIIRKTQGHE